MMWLRGTCVMVWLAFVGGTLPAEVAGGADGVPKPATSGDEVRLEQSRQLERERRLAQGMLDDLNAASAVVLEEVEDLERRITTILPLESPRREAGLSELLDLYYGYLGAIDEYLAETEEDLAEPDGATARIADRYSDLANDSRDVASRFREEVKVLDRELQRLVYLLERRRDLEAQLAVQKERLARIEERLAEDGLPEVRRKEQERHHDEAGARVRILQDELRALADIDEGLLKHYAVLIEQGKGETEWLTLLADRYEAFRSFVESTLQGFRPRRLEDSAHRELIRFCEAQISRLTRQQQALDRREERVSAAGSLRDLDRSRELSAIYDRFSDRYRAEIARLRTLIGAVGADLAE